MQFAINDIDQMKRGIVMWCPKCKNEYVSGITRCVDCDCDLVESLDFDTDTEEPEDIFVSKQAMEDYIEEKESSSNAAPSHTYISKKAKKEDVKSTAYTFLLVSIAGFILLGLFYAGVLPLYVADYMKVIIGIVMGTMFLVFFVVGVRSFLEIKVLDAESSEEENLFHEVTEWFKSTHTTESIDAKIDTTASNEQLYFSRYEVMEQIISEKYPDLEASFFDHIIEELYSELFSE